jgi:hypothetical protein
MKVFTRREYKPFLCKDVEDDRSELTLVASTFLSSTDSHDIHDLDKVEDKQLSMGTHSILENRIQFALTNLRASIAQIEAAKMAGPTKDDRKPNLIYALCSLQSAMDNVDDASKCLQLGLEEAEEDCEEEYDDDDDDDDDTGYDEGYESAEREYARLICCLQDYEDELDNYTVKTEDTTTIREKEMDRILKELRNEEAILQDLIDFTPVLREQQEEQDQRVIIFGNNNAGDLQHFSSPGNRFET